MAKDINHKKISLSEQMYQILKEKIYNLEYQPGTNLSVSSLSKELEVGKSPIRDALQRLSQDKLVQIFPQSGTRVSLINMRKVEEERFLRKSLELHALQEVFNQSDFSLIEAMEKSIEKQKKIDFNQNLLSFVQEDNYFHQLIFQQINMTDCWTLLKDYTSNDYRVRLLIHKTLIKTNICLLQNHQDLVQALKEKNNKRALEIDTNHLGKINFELINLSSNFPFLFESSSKDKQQIVPSQIRKISTHNENFLTHIQ